MYLKSSLLVILLSVCSSAAAEVYRWVDEDGNVIFSDTQREGAERVEIGETTVVPAWKAPRPAPAGAAGRSEDGPTAYESVAIERPEHEATLRNDRNVEVSVSLSPELQTSFGHRLQLIVDGEPFAKPGTRRSFKLPEVDRGTHELQAVVYDRNGEEIARSGVSVFYMHRTSVLNTGGGPPARGASPAGAP